MTCAGTAQVGRDGQFTVPQMDTGPAQIMLLDGQGRLVLLGYADAKTPKSARISPFETAVALIFDGLAPVLPPSRWWPDVIELIRQDNKTKELADVVSQRVAADPLALDKGDSAIADKLAAILEGFKASASAGASRHSASTSSRAFPQDTPISLVTDISPGGVVSGVELICATDTNGVQFVNHYRRHCGWRAYRTGYYDVAEGDVMLQQWAPMPAPPFTGIAATHSPSGPIGTLIDLITGQVAYAPEPTPPFDLPINPDQARKTYYRLLVVGPSGSAETLESLLAGYPISAEEKSRLKQMQEFCAGVTLLQEIVLPFAFQVVPVDNIMKGLSSSEAQQASWDVYLTLVQLVPAVATEMRNRDFLGALNATLKALASSDQVRNKLIAKLVEARIITISTGMTLESFGEAWGKNAVLYVKIADALVTLFDINVVIGDVIKSQPLVPWSATAWRPVVMITPNPAEVAPGASVTLLSQGTSGIEGNLVYAWETSGQYGRLEDDRGHQGTSFETSASSVRYVCSAGAPDGATDTVKLSVFRTRLGGRDFIGSAQGTVRVRKPQAQFALTPSSKTIKKSQTQRFWVTLVSGSLPPDAQVECDWTCTQTHGALFTGDESQQAPFTLPYGASAVYKAGLQSTGTDTITVKVMLVTPGGRSKVGECSGTVTVEGGQIVEHRLFVWGPIYYVEGSTSVYEAGVSLLFVFDSTARNHEVIFHTPGHIYDGTVGVVKPQITKAGIEATHGGHNIYGLTDQQRGHMMVGGPSFGVKSTPPATEEWSAAEFAHRFPNWQNAASDPAIQGALGWTLEVLNSW
ncbi:MAG: hypothetical protein N2512_05025 [Armatimonadetes bacterium]|nr:hypothetical protein [Armatimonadota bacterium]